MKKKNHYLKIIEWSQEDQCYIGSIPGWIGKCCHGDNKKEVYKRLYQILDEWIKIYEDDNIPLPANLSETNYSENIRLKIDDGLNQELAIQFL